MRNFNYTLHSYSENAIYISFGNGISSRYLSIIKSIMGILTKEKIPSLIEAVPGYNNITVYYDPLILYQEYKYTNVQQNFLNKIDAILQDLEINDHIQNSIVSIPVCYDQRLGVDIEFVAKYNDLTIEDVIHYHSNPKYTVHMIGFSPGFPFLGGMGEQIATPRKKVPSQHIAAGSVGIAGKQTGIYPYETPGGWQIIGRTPISLFNIQKRIPSLLKSGDYVKFYPISFEEFIEWEGESDDFCH